MIILRDYDGNELGLFTDLIDAKKHAEARFGRCEFEPMMGSHDISVINHDQELVGYLEDNLMVDYSRGVSLAEWIVFGVLVVIVGSAILVRYF